MTSFFLKIWTLVAIVTLSLVAPAAAQDSYRLKSGDVLSIEVLEDPSLNREVLILPSGQTTQRRFQVHSMAC